MVAHRSSREAMPKSIGPPNTIEKRRKKTYRVTLRVKISHPETPYSVIKQSRKACKDQLDVLFKHLGALGFLTAYTQIARIFAPTIAKKLEAKIWTEFIDQNEILTPTMRICEGELQGTVYELLAGVYSGAARTLRYVLEIAVEACVFETDIGRPTYKNLTDEYRSSTTGKGIVSRIRPLIRYNLWASFTERYNIYEQTKRIAPSFAEQVNVLNSRQLFQESPEVQSELKKIYETLSNYSHLSLYQIERALRKREPLQPRFDSRQFETVYQLALRVLDVIQFIYVKSISHFYGHQSATSFLRDLSLKIQIPKDDIDSFLRLPFCSRLAEGITWTPLDRK